MTKKIRNYLGRDLKKHRENDRLTKNQRSNLMSKVRSKSTKFEEDFVEELIKTMKVDFKRNVRSVRGTPDLLFEEQKICVFLDSDFWHGWQYPRWKHLLKSDFWREKIEKNRARDRRVTAYLRKHGWVVIRIWEHNIKKNVSVEIERIVSVIQQ